MHIKFSEYMCHVYVRGDNLAGVLISDHDYPHRVSHTLITKVIIYYSISYVENMLVIHNK